MSLRLSRFTGQIVVDDELALRISPMLLALCVRTAVPAPVVVIRSDLLRTAAVVARRDTNRLVLSKPFVQQLTDNELQAILAHECAHIVNGDMAAAKRREVIALLGSLLATGAFGFWFKGDFFVNLPIYLAIWLLSVIATRSLLALTNRPRELRADRSAAEMTGDPAALASALEVAGTM